VCIVVCDGLKGLPESITTIWQYAQVQACIPHLIRNGFRYASRRDWPPMGEHAGGDQGQGIRQGGTFHTSPRPLSCRIAEQTARIASREGTLGNWCAQDRREIAPNQVPRAPPELMARAKEASQAQHPAGQGPALANHRRVRDVTKRVAGDRLNVCVSLRRSAGSATGRSMRTMSTANVSAG
jgi:hypothetical protein